MSLSIFSFEKRDPRTGQPMQTGAECLQSAPSVAVLDEPRERHGPSGMLLDLEHLTPETLDKFFPSESTLAVAGR